MAAIQHLSNRTQPAIDIFGNDWTSKNEVEKRLKEEAKRRDDAKYQADQKAKDEAAARKLADDFAEAVRERTLLREKKNDLDKEVSRLSGQVTTLTTDLTNTKTTSQNQGNEVVKLNGSIATLNIELGDQKALVLSKSSEITTLTDKLSRNSFRNNLPTVYHNRAVYIQNPVHGTFLDAGRSDGTGKWSLHTWIPDLKVQNQQFILEKRNVDDPASTWMIKSRQHGKYIEIFAGTAATRIYVGEKDTHWGGGEKSQEWYIGFYRWGLMIESAKYSGMCFNLHSMAEPKAGGTVAVWSYTENNVNQCWALLSVL